MNGIIFDIKEMAVHDGPGIRTTVFFKGCPLRCKWCHNPEGLSFEPQLMYKQKNCLKCNKCKIKCTHPECQSFGQCVHICPENCLSVAGKKVSEKELAKELIQSAQILGNDFGGFTFSGGEPLAQSEFLIELAKQLKGFHLCIETSGFCDQETFEKVLKYIDFVIMDIKLADNNLHQKYTGVGNEKIIENFKTLSRSKKPHIIRTPLIPNITDTKENLEAIKNIIGNSTWEHIPYNVMAGAKYKMLGMKYELDGLK